MPTFYEFFAGGGMVRAGLGSGWTCLFANDIDPKKARSYAANWGGDALRVADVRDLTSADLPDEPDLVWASFPCQDLSLAGPGAGLRGPRSGAFWPFWSLVESLGKEGRAPKLVVLENVCGALTSHGGADFAAICEAYAKAGYRVGAIVVDAALFVPQSRPRLFIIGLHTSVEPPAAACGPDPLWHPRVLRAAHAKLSEEIGRSWLWWSPPPPPARNVMLADLLEDDARVTWRPEAETARLLNLMSPCNRAKVEAAASSGRRAVGALYRRTRPDGAGGRVQRVEARFDGLAGCLRTPAGGSSRQNVIVVESEQVSTRLMSGRETARLMGLPDDYWLPEGHSEACHLTGDGVAAPVVRHLAHHVFEPVRRRARRRRAA